MAVLSACLVGIVCDEYNGDSGDCRHLLSTIYPLCEQNIQCSTKQRFKEKSLWTTDRPLFTYKLRDNLLIQVLIVN